MRYKREFRFVVPYSAALRKGEEMSSRRVAGLLTFVAGATIVATWSKIRNFLKSRSQTVRENVSSLGASEIEVTNGEKEMLVGIPPQGEGEELLFKTPPIAAQSETSIDGMLIISSKGKSILFNKRFGEMWNIPQQILDAKDNEKMLQYVLAQLKNPNKFLKKVRYLSIHKDERSSDEIEFKDGKVFARYSSPLLEPKGSYYGRICYFRDITERKKLQKQLIQSEKMASLGLLAADVSHEIKNTLATIIQGIQYLKSSVVPDDISLRDSVKRIEKAALHANKIVTDLLNFSRQSPPEWKKLDISVVIEETLSLIERQANLKNIKIIRQFALDLPKVRVDSNQMEQVVINILLNSINAMPKGGTITISLKQIKTQPKKNYLQLTFTDTGYGIPKDEIQKVFDPFFSNEKKEGGIGLGLSVTRKIIEWHKGTIRIESRIGKGTDVVIVLPVVKGGGRHDKKDIDN